MNTYMKNKNEIIFPTLKGLRKMDTNTVDSYMQE